MLLGASLIEKKVGASDVWVWIENVPGVSGVGIGTKVSNGEIASRVAVRMPYLSQLRYLYSSSDKTKHFIRGDFAWTFD